ncbi:MAG: hypothetical protein PUF12_12100 [Thermoflexaceae bacterium]|nr:hypothetical protein [Thermoflexaceae bacterium]
MVGGIGNGVYGSYNLYGSYYAGKMDTASMDKTPAEIKILKKTGAMECETCKNRKYQDGSNESDVSFKSPGHIDPGSSASTVMAHEQEHVSNAYEKAAQGNGKVINASVKLQTAVCPECGRSYVAGGETSTMIKYNESNPYGREAKSRDAAGLIGNNIDYAV